MINNNPVRVNNKWLFPNGKVLPVVSGGAFGDAAFNVGETEAKGEDGQQAATEVTAQGFVAPPPPPSVSVDAQQFDESSKVFTEEDIARVRREEKDKLYGNITKLQEQVQSLSKAEEERQKQIKAAEAEAEKQREQARLSEMSALDRVKEIEAKMLETEQSLRAEIEKERQIFQKEREYQELNAYKSQRIAEESDNIMPDLITFIKGDTVEEIESSISEAKATTSSILSNVSLAQQQHQLQAPPPVGTHVTSPPVGPMENQSSQQQLTPSDIAGMDMQTYAKERERLLSSVSAHARTRGIYG